MKHEKRDACKQVTEVIARNTGNDASKLLTRVVNFVYGMEEGCWLLYNSLEEGRDVAIYADFDCDGVTSASILRRYLAEALGIPEVLVKIPCRKEGYGLSGQYVDDLIEKGMTHTLLITVDNGITAVDEIRRAKDAGMKVLVIDHHEMRADGQLPCADVIIDPHADGGRSEFNGFCGAGLSYKFVQKYAELFGYPEPDASYAALAAIGTVADVVPLVEENRWIVIDGIEAINNGQTSPGLTDLVEKMGILPIQSEDIAFTIAPTINAAGRTEMVAGEAEKAYRLLSESDGIEIHKAASELIANNNARKAMTKDYVQTAETKIADQCLYGEIPLVIAFDARDGVKVGMVGLIAGRMAESMKCPVIVLTEKDGTYTGSMRTFGNVNCKELLDASATHLMRYGGHAGAAGLTLCKEDLFLFKGDIQRAMEAVDFTVDETEYYDLEIEASDIDDVLAELETYAPYGEGNPEPVFKVNAFRMFPRAGQFFKRMGSDESSLKLYGKGVDAVCFDPEVVDKYDELGTPTYLTLYGTLSVNRYMSPYVGLSESSQIRVEDLEKAYETTKRKNNLADALKARMATL